MISMAKDKWSTKQKIGAALLGVGTLAGIGLAISKAVSPDKKPSLLGESGLFLRRARKLGRANCTPCGEE
jgi:hypothetical protein